MGNIPSTSSESIPDDALLKSLENQASLVGSPLTPPNNKFLRTLRCRRAGENEITVVKVFFVKNLDLAVYREKLKAQKTILTPEVAPNVLPYQRFREGGGSSPAFVSRQYFFANLKDRLSTRPFLADVEKLWIAYCLINAGRQIHSAGLAHGDIKSENVVLTSWGWPVLTDLAPFKPTFLQADQSAAPFNFFFSIGRKRCYIAPERFLSSQSIGSSSSKSGTSKEALKRRFAEVMASKEADVKKAADVLADATGIARSAKDEKDALMAQTALLTGEHPADANLLGWRKDVNEDLLPSMDVFSIGCVLIELFNADGEAAFELSDALQYAAKGESVRLNGLLAKISNEGIRSLVQSMTQHDPATRLSLDSYLKKFKSTFPASFSSFLYEFMRSFLRSDSQESVEDSLVWRTCERYGEICEALMGIDDKQGKYFFEGFAQRKADRDAFFASGHHRGGGRSSTASPMTPATPSFDPDDIHFDAMESTIRELERKLNAVVKSTPSRTSEPERNTSEHVYNEEDDSTATNGVERQSSSSSSSNHCSPVIIVVSYLCMTLQLAAKSSTRVLALLLVKRFCTLERNSEVILSRVLPFLVDRLQDRLQDTSAWVRCTALRTIADLLEVVDHVPPSEHKIFSDYLFPGFTECARDASEAVRVTFASCLPSLASSAKRFLELARQQQYLVMQSSSSTSSNATSDTNSNNNNNNSNSNIQMLPYDAELGALHDAIQKMIDRTVATDHSGGGSDLAVKLALVSQVMPLCLFFGRDRIDRWLLLWLLSVVNTRGPGNWRLQVAVLRSLASIGAFAGDEAFDQYLYPLIDDMLSVNSHELVVEAAAHCLTSLVNLSLLRSVEMFKLVKKVGPMVRHPSLRVRRAALLLLAAISSSKVLPHVDVQLFVAEKLRPFYSGRNNNEAEKFIILLGKHGKSLETNAILLEQCLNTEPYPSLQEWIQAFSKSKSSASSGQQQSAGNNSSIARATSSAKLIVPESVKELKAMVRVHFLKTNESTGTNTAAQSQSPSPTLEPNSLRAIRNRYGIVLEEFIPARSLLRRALALELPETKLNLGRLRSDWTSRSPSPVHPVYGSADAFNAATGAMTGMAAAAAGGPISRTNNHGGHGASAAGGGARTGQGSSLATTTASSFSPDWRPRGLLVTSFHEHSGPVNRVAVADDFSFVVTGSDDGTAKIWRTDKLDRNPCPRSRVTFETQGGRIVDVCSIRGTTSIGVASDSGRVSVVRVDAAMPDAHRNLKIDSGSRPVAVSCVSVNELAACTEKGSIYRWDLRSGARMGELSLMLGFGSISCMTVSPDGLWLALGTHRGVVAMFDLRFNMLIAAWRHPCSCAVHRIYCAKSTVGLPLVYVAAGPNQAVLLNVETGETRFAFACAHSEFTADKAKLTEWKASQESLFAKKWDQVDLSARQLDRYVQEAKFPTTSVHSTAFSSSHPSIRALYCPSDLILSHQHQVYGSGEPQALLTAGTDMVIRYWDCHGGSNSSVVSAPPDEPKVKWEAKDFNSKRSVMFMSLSMQKNANAPPSKSKGKFVVRPAHQDAVLDIAGLRMLSDGSPHIITAGRDSVVRIWK